MSNKKGLPTKIGLFIIQLSLAVSFLYPLIYMFINSLKTRNDYLMHPFAIPLNNLSIDNYRTMISQFQIFTLFLNTGFICIIATLFVVIFSTIAGFAFSKLHFRGIKIVYLVIISTIFIPIQATIVPMYVLFSKVHLVNNAWSVILSYTAVFLPEAILLMTSNFHFIPNELLESAELDGCNYFQKMIHVVMPLGKPAISLCIIFYVILFWNDLFTPMILLNSSSKQTVMVALTSLVGRYTGDPTLQFAGLFMAAVPAIIIYIFFQKNIIKGLSAGSIK